MKKLLLILLFPVLTYSQSPDSLVGVWQDAENLGSGWSNSFLFFKDGNYAFFANQMDCSKRLKAYYGTWKISTVEDAILLSTDSKVIVEGGKMMKADGSCGSDSMLIGGQEKTIVLSPKEELDYAISKVYFDDTKALQRKFIYIDAMKYWYMGDPVEMRIQFEGE
jgi:hypothetical protein